MKLSLTLLSLTVLQASCSAVQLNEADAACVDSSEAYLKHPTELGIKSSLDDPQGEAASTEQSTNGGDMGVFDYDEDAVCPLGKGKGKGAEYDYGCYDGWCWRNCDGPFKQAAFRKYWCWLKYEGGKGGWTPCGRWQDCRWSYDNKNAKCVKAKKGCGECGCGC